MISSVSDAETQSTNVRQNVSEIVREAIASELEVLIPSLRASMKPELIHEGVVCSICSVTPIVGPRYYCNQCNMDICEVCEPDHMHNLIKYKTHSIIKSSPPPPETSKNVNMLSLTGKIDYIQSELGFKDRRAVLSALSSANYDVNTAIENLLKKN